MFLPRPRLLLLFAFVAGVASSLPGQQERQRRTCQIGRVERRDAPRIDGSLADDCWRTAPAIGDLTMVEPWQGRQPNNRTVVKLLHDRRYLYIALWCYQDPAEIRRTQRVRDARLDPDDRVEILLDPFENRRTAYWFQIGAGGSIGDALVSANGQRFDKPFDVLWLGESRVTDDGWIAELAIPFRSIPRREGALSWGFNLRRIVRGANEEYQWDNVTQAVPFFRVSELGTMAGFGEIDRGIGLDVVPFVALGAGRDRTASDDSWDVDPDMGGEMYYRLTPSITLATTILTDFAQTENDGRQINLNRFPLFFPERRDFFLDGQSYYTFGSQFAGGTRFLPYFTRRVGLSGGTPVPILWGMKLTGESGPFEIGLLDVQVDGTETTDEENLAIARVKYALGEQTTVGVIATNGNPASTGDNTLFGVDFYHRVPEFIGDMDLQISVEGLVTTGERVDDDGESFGIDLQARGTEWSAQIGSRWVSDEFAPALGFVRRRGVRQSEVEVGYRPRVAEGSVIRRYLFEGSLQRVDTWQGSPLDDRLRLDRVGVEFQNGDSVSVFVRRSFERVNDDFDLFRGSTTIFAGDYWTTRYGVRINTNEGRPWSGSVSLFGGDFFDGKSHGLNSDVAWRTSPLLTLGLGYDTTTADLALQRGFTTHIASGIVDLFFSPTLSLQNLVQFDNESEQLGWQSRLRWIYEPGCDFFAVLGTSWQRTEDESLVPTQQQLNFKIAHTLRF